MMCLHRVGCGHMQNKAAGSTWVFFSSLNAWNIRRLIVGPHVQHPVCKRGWYAACLPQMLPPVCVFLRVLQGPEAIVVGGLPARLWAFQESTAAAAELTLWWKSERAAVFFLSFVWLLPLIAPQHVPPLPAGGSGPSAGSASGRGPLQQEGNVTDACARGRMMRFKFNAAEKKKKKERLEKPVNHSKGKLFSKSQRTSFKIMCWRGDGGHGLDSFWKTGAVNAGLWAILGN